MVKIGQKDLYVFSFWKMHSKDTVTEWSHILAYWSRATPKCRRDDTTNIADQLRVHPHNIDGNSHYTTWYSESNSYIQTFITALYHLAAYPEYVSPLRTEVESIIKEQGWSKSAFTSMHKLDSFLKETLRMTGLDGSRCIQLLQAVPNHDSFLVSMGRAVLKDLTLSDGTTVPTGLHIYASATAAHFDEVHLSFARLKYRI